MRKGYWLAVGAGLGALTGLAVVALAYLGQQAFALPFIPFVFFEWLTRVLPGGLITLGIDSMVRLIVGLGLGPIDVVAKGMEQLLGTVLWLAASAAIGARAGRLAPASHAQPAGLSRARAGGRGPCAGLVLAVLVVIAMLGLRQFAAGQPCDAALARHFALGWGGSGMLLEAGLLLERPAVAGQSRSQPYPNRCPAPPETPPVRGAPAHDGMGRREFLLRAGGGSLLIAARGRWAGHAAGQRESAHGRGQAARGAESAGRPEPATPPANPARRAQLRPAPAASAAAAHACRPQSRLRLAPDPR